MTLILSGGSGNATISTDTNNAINTASSTSGFSIPVGTTAQRPANATAGTIRYNTTTSTIEAYVNGAWGVFTVTVPPTNTVAPVISGTASQGQTLTTTNGTWANSPTSYTYQWLANATAIGGATSNTFVLTSTQVGANVTCNVTAYNAGGNSTATSNALGPVTNTYTINYLAVAGGGGGGGFGGGGGAGGLLANSTTLTIGTVYTLTVGSGGSGGPSSYGSGTPGGYSYITASGGFSNVSAVGGGQGAGQGGSSSVGGSGGGGAGTGGGPSAGTAGQGNAGGGSSYAGGCYYAGGGGGAGAAGGTSGGGIGLQSSITGSAVYYAGGGGGGSNGCGTGADGSGTYGKGGYGGGNGGAGQGGNGGIIILSIPTSSYSGTYTGSPSISTSGGNTILQFTGSGTYTA